MEYIEPSFFLNYYFISFALSVFLTMVFLFKSNFHHTLDFTLFYIFTSITNLGLWQRSIATVLEHAVFAQQISYLGGCYATLSLLFCTLYLCKIKINKALKIILFLSSSIIFCTTFTIGYSQIFYRQVYLVREGETSKLFREYGAAHYLFYALLIFYYLICFTSFYIAIAKKKDVSIRNVMQLLIIMGVGLLSYFVGHRFFSVELTPVWYVTTEIIFYIIDGRLALYDIDRTVINSFVNHNTMGVVSFDRNFHFLGCNGCAKDFYPPLKLLKVDRKVDSSNTELHELCTWIEFFQKDIKSEFYYKKNDQYYKITYTTLFCDNREQGHQILITDCTEEKIKESKLIKISITDELTKLFNRRAFEEEIEKIQSDGIPEDFTILSFDLNGLKKANDTKGHAAGDELIIESAKTLNAVIESYGYVYRTGGDEYIAIAICTKEQQEDIFRLIDNYSRLWKGTYSTGLSISKGAASITEFPDYSIDQLEKEAEKRMYKDKTRFYIESGIERRRV